MIPKQKENENSHWTHESQKQARVQQCVLPILDLMVLTTHDDKIINSRDFCFLKQFHFSGEQYDPTETQAQHKGPKSAQLLCLTKEQTKQLRLKSPTAKSGPHMMSVVGFDKQTVLSNQDE